MTLHSLADQTDRVILVDGSPRRVLNQLSSGLGCEPHTFELSDEAYVYRIGNTWKLQERGHFARPVVVLTEKKGVEE